MTGDATERLHDKLQMLAAEDTAVLPSAVETMLRQELAGMTVDERLKSLELLAARLSAERKTATGNGTSDSVQMAHLCSMLLGKDLSADTLSSGDTTEKFVAAMNMIFDSLNRIVRVMQTTLVGNSDELETIRQVIGSQLERYEGTMSVREYLDQIQQAFLVSHNSFQQAARNVAGGLLKELDPDRISSSVEPGLRFGPLRKAELYDIYQEKHQSLTGWLQSEQFIERLLREFEEICRKSYRV